MFAVIDFETGGLDNKICAITQVGVTRGHIVDGKYVELAHYSSYVRVGDRLMVCREALKVQGRSAEHVFRDTWPTEAEVWPHMLDALNYGRTPIFAHFSSFDHGFACAMEARVQPGTPVFADMEFGCTKRTFLDAKKHGHFPEELSSRLDDLCAHFGITKAGQGKHDALEDARAAAHLYALCKGKTDEAS